MHAPRPPRSLNGSRAGSRSAPWPVCRPRPGPDRGQGRSYRDGIAIYRGFVSDEDVAGERVKAADAVIPGKTTVPEFGCSGAGYNPVSPAARNPWNTAMAPGGSSAGSGASVAPGVSSVALSTDSGGSVRIPTADCGIYGFKASMGRVPMYPGARDEHIPVRPAGRASRTSDR
ncbi:amidase family protein [Streptomyces sp. 049-1]|uniref:amidase family protein n=1 Tax=Streptomyces sp. 049-1 TaxID=2789264 RepID=UPI00397EB502